MLSFLFSETKKTHEIFTFLSIFVGIIIKHITIITLSSTELIVQLNVFVTEVPGTYRIIQNKKELI